jgi:hypothetical protein
MVVSEPVRGERMGERWRVSEVARVKGSKGRFDDHLKDENEFGSPVIAPAR